MFVCGKNNVDIYHLMMNSDDCHTVATTKTSTTVGTTAHRQTGTQIKTQVNSDQQQTTTKTLYCIHNRNSQ